MQSVLTIQCFVCKVSLICSAFGKCPYYAVRRVQIIRVIDCVTCSVTILCSALYAKCSYYVMRVEFEFGLSLGKYGKPYYLHFMKCIVCKPVALLGRPLRTSLVPLVAKIRACGIVL